MPAPVEPGTMKGPWKLDAAGEGSGVGSGDTTAGVELAGITISGMGPVLPTRCPASEAVSGVGLGCTGAGELPVGPTTPPRSEERRLPTGALGAGEGEGDGEGVGIGRSFSSGVVEGAVETLEDAGTIIGGSTPVLPTMGRFPSGLRAGLEDWPGVVSAGSLSGVCGWGVNAGDEVPSEVRPVEPLTGLEGGCGRCSTGSGEAGTGDGRWLPVPGRDSLLSGTGVTTISWISVVVLVRELLLLLLTTSEVSEPSLLKNGARIDERSICRDSTCCDVVLEDDGEVVGAAGAVEFVTI